MPPSFLLRRIRELDKKLTVIVKAGVVKFIVFLYVGNKVRSYRPSNEWTEYAGLNCGNIPDTIYFKPCNITLNTLWDFILTYLKQGNKCGSNCSLFK